MLLVNQVQVLVAMVVGGKADALDTELLLPPASYTDSAGRSEVSLED